MHDVHDLHATQIATGVAVLTAHVVVDDSCSYDGHLMQMLDQSKPNFENLSPSSTPPSSSVPRLHSVHEYTTHD